VLEQPGQLDVLAAGDGVVWVSGFRRSRQADVTTALRPDGSALGEVSFADVDLRPWAPPPPSPRPPMLPRPERARRVREALERALSSPQQVTGRFGDTWEAPPVDKKLRLERVELRGSEDDPQVAVLFRWAGEDDLFGMSHHVFGETEEDDEDSADAPDAYISVYLEENLIASGYGLANAIREPADGVTWLRWPLPAEWEGLDAEDALEAAEDHGPGAGQARHPGSQEGQGLL
jgi:hypothetical protein